MSFRGRIVGYNKLLPKIKYRFGVQEMESSGNELLTFSIVESTRTLSPKPIRNTGMLSVTNGVLKTTLIDGGSGTETVVSTLQFVNCSTIDNT